MSAIRHGVEQLPPGVGRPVDPAARYRCGWCTFAGTRDQVDAHEDAEHPVTPVDTTSRSDREQLASWRIQNGGA